MSLILHSMAAGVLKESTRVSKCLTVDSFENNRLNVFVFILNT